nr:protein ROS1-like isoform X1 [Ipomoea batatas]
MIEEPDVCRMDPNDTIARHENSFNQPTPGQDSVAFRDREMGCKDEVVNSGMTEEPDNVLPSQNSGVSSQNSVNSSHTQTVDIIELAKQPPPKPVVALPLVLAANASAAFLREGADSSSSDSISPYSHIPRLFSLASVWDFSNSSRTGFGIHRFSCLASPSCILQAHSLTYSSHHLLEFTENLKFYQVLVVKIQTFNGAQFTVWNGFLITVVYVKHFELVCWRLNSTSRAIHNLAKSKQ